MLRARDWLEQARRDLRHAEGSVGLGDYEWACFASQQAAEKALKALYQALGAEAWGHDLTRLLRRLRELGVEPPEELVAYAAILDKHYVAARYPSAYTEGYPGEHYTRLEAEQCIRAARAILGWVEGLLEALGERAERGAREARGQDARGGRGALRHRGG